MSLINQLVSGVTKSQKRVGRGYGSGRGGHTSSRGQKGQLSRGGGSIPVWFEGGQLPLIKRLPMWRGKGRLKSVTAIAEVTLSDLNRASKPEVTLETLKIDKIIAKRATGVKVIATGEIKQKVTLEGMTATPAAKKAIEAAGGKVN